MLNALSYPSFSSKPSVLKTGRGGQPHFSADCTVDAPPSLGLTNEEESLLRGIKRLCDHSLPPHVRVTLTVTRTNGTQPAVKPAPKIRLSPIQQELLPFFVQGWTSQEIAKQLGISKRAIELRSTGLFTALGVRNRAEAVACAIRNGFVSAEGRLPNDPLSSKRKPSR